MEYNTPYFSEHTGEQIDQGVKTARETIPAQLAQLFAGANLHVHILEDDFMKMLAEGAVDLTKYYYLYSDTPMIPNSLSKIYFGDLLFAQRSSSDESSGFPCDFPIIF